MGKVSIPANDLSKLTAVQLKLFNTISKILILTEIILNSDKKVCKIIIMNFKISGAATETKSKLKSKKSKFYILFL